MTPMASDESSFLINVLVIEDDSALLDAMARRLGGLGLAVIAARNGNDAVDLLRCRSVDVVVSDVVMEGLVGTALLDAIHATPGHEHTPVVFMSSLPEERVRALIDGEYAFLRKPVRLPELANAIAEATEYPVQPTQANPTGTFAKTPSMRH
jgi:two-component system response regulator HydG